MTLPNFLIFGVQKAGTTSIYNYLKQHPQVFMSPVKETNFMEHAPLEFDEAAEPATPQFDAKGRRKLLTIHDYKSLFEGVRDEVAIGEASPNYLFHHERTVQTIQKYVPNTKLIAILRNPVDRAYSDYLMHVREVIGEPKPLAIQLEQKAETSYTLLKGKYYEGIKHFLDVFGSEQVKVFLYDDLSTDSVAFMRDIYNFIGVDRSFDVNTKQRKQMAEVPKFQTINQLLRTENPFRIAARSLLRKVLSEEKRQQLRSRLIAVNSQGKESMPLSAEDRQLLETYYREDVQQLQDLIGQDLSRWFDLS